MSYEVWWLEVNGFRGPRNHPRFRDTVVSTEEELCLCCKRVKTFRVAIDVVVHLMSFNIEILKYYGKLVLVKDDRENIIEKKYIEKAIQQYLLKK